MLAVALMAFGIASVQTAQRWLDYRGQSRQYAEFARISREHSLHPEVGGCAMMRDVENYEEMLRSVRASHARYNLQLADYYLQLSEKYALAMRRPWLPVEPDPPTPE